MKRKKKKGSSLIEIIIAIGIMAVLAALAFVYVVPQITKAQDARTKQNLITIRSAFLQYYDDYRCFPKSIPSCGQEFKQGNVVYINSFPCNDDGTPYEYQTDNNTCPTWYKVLTNLKNTNDQSIDAIGCRNGCGAKCNYNYGVTSTNISINQNCPQTPQNKYACTPSGQCVIFADPNMSRCPLVFLNDPTCQNKCSAPANRCHDSRGKQN